VATNHNTLAGSDVKARPRRRLAKCCAYCKHAVGDHGGLGCMLADLPWPGEAESPTKQQLCDWNAYPTEVCDAWEPMSGD